MINWTKVVDPTTCLTFLGIEIDTLENRLSLDPVKLQAFLTEIGCFMKKRRATRKQLERMAVKLNWAANVVVWGKVHTRGIYNVLSFLKSPSHKARLAEIRADLDWWFFALTTTTNRRVIWDKHPIVSVQTDALPVAGGGFCGLDWLYTVWHIDCPEIASSHINIKELGMVLKAAERWCHLWGNKRVYVYTDSAVTAYIINKGSTGVDHALTLLRKISTLALMYNFQSGGRVCTAAG